jgi:uncharacterized membrane protein
MADDASAQRQRRRIALLAAWPARRRQRGRRALHRKAGDDLSALLRNPAVVGGGLLGLIGLMRRSPMARPGPGRRWRWRARSSGGGGSARVEPARQRRGQRIDLEKSIRIDAAPDEVYDMWTNYENFPRFMSHVVEVRDLGRRRSHWVVQGPAGTQFEFDSVLTEQTKEPHRLAWRSEAGRRDPETRLGPVRTHRGGTLRHRAPVLHAAGRRARPWPGLAARVRPERPDGRRPGAHEAIHRARRHSARCGASATSRAAASCTEAAMTATIDIQSAAMARRRPSAERRTGRLRRPARSSWATPASCCSAKRPTAPTSSTRNARASPSA